jgi:large subunit ribosomal protein L20
MARVKKAVNALKSRRNLLKQTKGYRFGRSKKKAAATEAMMHAGAYAFAHRRDKKNDMRKLWNIKIGSAAKTNGTSFSVFLGALKKKNISLDRKILADFAENNPETLKRIFAEVK